MSRITRRLANLAGFLICAALIAYALYAEHALDLAPCPLCVFQRIGIIALGIGFLLAAAQNPAGGGAYLYAVLIAVAALATALVAGRHIWLQGLPADQVPACGADLGYLMDTVPFAEVLKLVLTGSGECATIDWSFLSLSMPAWVLIAAIFLGLFGVVANTLIPAFRPKYR